MSEYRCEITRDGILFYTVWLFDRADQTWPWGKVVSCTLTKWGARYIARRELKRQPRDKADKAAEYVMVVIEVIR